VTSETTNTSDGSAAESGFVTKLTSREEIAEGTMAFYFHKPSNWTFVAGQFVDMTLINPPETDAEGNIRSFSIASAPFEDTIMIATRMRDTAFKRVLKTVPLDTEVQIKGPSGKLTLHYDATRPAVILSGGIGITPFRSILLQAAKEHRPHHLFFFDANRRPEDAPFLADMNEAERQNQNFKFIPVMSKIEDSRLSWDGERGLIDAKMVARFLAGVTSATYYVTGPPGLVKAMQAVLKDRNADDDDIRTEEFTGY
jgi:ferredoxin-NADP reductase